MLSRVALIFLCCAPVSLLAQIGYPGQYPYPQGRLPGGIPIPYPRRGGDPGAQQTTVHAQGKLRKIDSKSLTVDADDGRTLQLRRTRDTKFYRDGTEIDASQLHPGDRVSAEATQDRSGNLTVRTIRLDNASEAGPQAEENAEDAEDKDPDRPVLRRGAPENRTAPAHEDADNEAPPEPERPGDAVVLKARTTSGSFSATLPNYIATQFITRYQSDSRPVNWHALDVVSAEVVYEDGKESYRNVSVNGRQTHKGLEDTGGAWSTGEFGTMLRDLFASTTPASFRFARESAAAGLTVRVYEFEVPRPNSHWHVETGGQSIVPAYRGSIWIDPRSGRVLRIETQARFLPSEFPLDTVETAVDYSGVRIGSEQALLPVHAETLACQRGSNECSRNVIDFRNYHKYGADSNVTFDKTAQ